MGRWFNTCVNCIIRRRRFFWDYRCSFIFVLEKRIYIYIGFQWHLSVFYITELFIGEGVNDDCFFSLLIVNVSGDLIELGIGEPLAVGIGVRRVKKFIRFCVLYRSRIALTSVFVVFNNDGTSEDGGGWTGTDDDSGTGEGEHGINDDGDALEVRDGVLDCIRLADVGVWKVDLAFAFDNDESLWRGDKRVVGLEVWFVVEADGIDLLLTGVGFDVVWTFAERWEAIDDDAEVALAFDLGLIERLRDTNVDGRVCCAPGWIGLGIKPKRVCIAVGGGARFVIDIGLMEAKVMFQNTKNWLPTKSL